MEIHTRPFGFFESLSGLFIGSRNVRFNGFFYLLSDVVDL